MGIARDVFKKVETQDGKKMIAFADNYIPGSMKKSNNQATPSEEPPEDSKETPAEATNDAELPE